MLRRGTTRFNTGKITSMSGNRIVGIRREDKNVWERRAPLVPAHVQELLKYKQVDRIIVQPSTTRCYHDAEYALAGAEINEDLSDAGTILAVKEVPGQLLLPDRSYMFFSHTIKAQAYNMPLLDTIVQKNVRLFDYERINGPDGRMVKFGPQAGYAGVIDALNALGLALMTRGFATPFLNVSLSREYRSLQVARESIRIAGDRIREHGVPKGAAPIVFGVTGSGSVSQAAQEILHLLPCKYIEVEDLPRLHARQNVDNDYVYVCIIKAKDMVTPKDPAMPFTTSHYYTHPNEYRAVFHDKVAPYLSVLITGHYWEPRFPRLLTTEQARELVDSNRFPMLVLADITCDIGGSIEFFVKSTSIQNPFYAYDITHNTAVDIQDFDGNGVVILGVDHLPAEFPRESSTSFGANLKPLVPIIASSKTENGSVSLEDQAAYLGKPLFNSMVTMGGSLTPNFTYITSLRNAQKEQNANNKQKKILVFGAGMMAAPCIFTLLGQENNTLTIVDVSQHNLTLLHNSIRKSENPKHEARCHFVRVDTSNNDHYIETLVKASDLVVSLLPAPMHPAIAEHTLRHKLPLVTASYVSPGMEKLRETAKESGTLIVNEMGLDPGIDLMTSAKLLNDIKAKNGKITKYISLCGALPAPENSNCPLGYKFSWSPFGVLTAATRPARCKIENEWYDIPGDFLYFFPQPIQQFKGLDLYWLPNGDCTKYANVFGIQEASTLVRGTIRYYGFSGVLRSFKSLGMLDNEIKYDQLLEGDENKNKTMSWPDLLVRAAFAGDVEAAKKAGATAANVEEWFPNVLRERLTARWKQIKADPAFKALQSSMLMASSESADQELNVDKLVEIEISEVMDNFSKLRLFSQSSQAPKTIHGTVIHSLCKTLIYHLSYKNHERDYVIMYHRVEAEFPHENKKRFYDMTLTMRGKTSVYSATAETVGVPVALTAQLVLDGSLDTKTHTGLISPTSPDVYERVLEDLARHGIAMQETVEEKPLNPAKI